MILRAEVFFVSSAQHKNSPGHPAISGLNVLYLKPQRTDVSRRVIHRLTPTHSDETGGDFSLARLPRQLQRNGSMSVSVSLEL